MNDFQGLNEFLVGKSKTRTNAFGLPVFQETRSTNKRQKFTPSQRLYVWKKPKIYGRTCHICHEQIEKQSDMELDHIRAHSKGGKTVALSHRECNRMKSSKGLKTIQRKMGFKTNTETKRAQNKATKKRKRNSTPENPFSLAFGNTRKTKNPFGW